MFIILREVGAELLVSVAGPLSLGELATSSYLCMDNWLHHSHIPTKTWVLTQRASPNNLCASVMQQ